METILYRVSFYGSWPCLYIWDNKIFLVICDKIIDKIIVKSKYFKFLFEKSCSHMRNYSSNFYYFLCADDILHTEKKIAKNLQI